MDQVRKNEIIAVALFAASLFLFLSIFTFSKQDLSFYTSTPNSVIHNVTGIVGSYVGGALLFVSGNAAYVVPLIIFVWGVCRLLQLEERKVYFKFFGTVVLVMAVGAILSMIGPASNEAAFDRGGLIGLVVAGFLVEYLGRVGATMFIIAMIILSVLVATEFLILPVVVTVFKLMRKVPSRVALLVPEKQSVSVTTDKASRKSKLKAAREDITKKLEAMKRQVEEVKSTALAPLAAGRTIQSKKVKERPEPKIITPEKIKKAPAKPVRVAPVPDAETGKNLDYKLPSLDLLVSPPKSNLREKEEVLKTKAALLEQTLLEFDVEAKVVKINPGPVITMYELEPAVGTKVNKITSLGDNISLALKSANIRIVAPLPGKGTIGVEVPNTKSESVLLKDILETEEYIEEESPLKIALGKDISGSPIIVDLAKMPHLLIAGATGSGKTVCLNGVICSFLLNASPNELKFLMIDPKRVELLMFEGIPHLISPIVTSPKKAAAALGWVVSEMERRYEIFAGKGVRNIQSYKEKRDEDEADMPYIVVIVDELADLIMVAQQDVEGEIMRIAQLSRAAGIHMILATQRPSVNVITGVIKANFPARISFKVASKVDSRTVLDTNGAEKLLGCGDMLLMEPGESSVIRGQCSLVQDKEIKDIVKVIKAQAGPQYVAEAMEKQDRKASGVDQEKDDLYMQAVEIVIGTKQASVSMVQRKLRVGYTRAARMIDIMEEEGIVGPYNGSKPREILIDDMEEVPEE